MTDRFVIAVSPHRHVTFDGPFPVTEEEWTQFLAVLELMKPGLVDDARVHWKIEGGMGVEEP